MGGLPLLPPEGTWATVPVKIEQRALVERQPDRWVKPPKGGWRLPVKAANGALVALLKRDRYGGGRLVVTTNSCLRSSLGLLVRLVFSPSSR
jgi:hypothetical protein